MFKLPWLFKGLSNSTVQISQPQIQWVYLGEKDNKPGVIPLRALGLLPWLTHRAGTNQGWLFPSIFGVGEALWLHQQREKAKGRGSSCAGLLWSLLGETSPVKTHNPCCDKCSGSQGCSWHSSITPGPW